jgi:hypothetical protein
MAATTDPLQVSDPPLGGNGDGSSSEGKTERFVLSINPNLINKNDTNNIEAFSKGWQTLAVSAHELAKVIRKGCAFSYVFEGEIRKAENFLATEMLAVDIDGTLTLDEVLENLFVQENASFLYTTPSHTIETPRLRVVFFTDRLIQDPVELKSISTALALRLSGDLAATDAARLFYGSTNAEVHFFNHTLQSSTLTDLMLQGEEYLKAKRSEEVVAFSTYQSNRLLDPHLNVQLRNRSWVSLDSIRTKTSIFCPDHFDTHPSAFVSINNKGNTFIYCHACQKTRWVTKPTPRYDFLSFEREVRSLGERDQTQEVSIETPFGPMQELEQLGGRIHLSNERHFSIKKLTDGLTFVKSPKGSGKTTMMFDVLMPLREIVKGGDLSLLFLEENDDGNEEPLYRATPTSFSILLIGHRQALIRELCKRLNLACYLDDERESSTSSMGMKTGQAKRNLFERQKRYGVCLDSINVVEASDYDLIILDECEQVLAHFLSSTIAARRDSVFRKFSSLLFNAKRVIALDADLSWISFMTLTDLACARSKDLSFQDKSTLTRSRRQIMDQSSLSKPISIFINSFPQSGKRLEVYQSKNLLLAHLLDDIEAGVKVFFTSNSKNQVDQLFAKFTHEFPEKRFLKVTSENSNSEEIQSILLDAKNSLLIFDAVLTSPSLSTGIDLTFENDQIVFERVYGLFQAKVNTHFDIDQQLSRVRHTEVTRCWVSHETFQFETELEVCSIDVMREHLRANTFSYVQAVEVELLEAEENSFLRMGALILSSDRASKNRLYENFLSHKTNHAVDIKIIEKDENRAKDGARVAKHGKQLARLQQVQLILQADTLSQRKFIEISERLRQSQPVSAEQLSSYQRHRIEFFNRVTELKENMVESYLDRYHSGVRLLEDVLSLSVDCDRLDQPYRLLCIKQREEVERLYVERSIQTKIDKPSRLLANTLLEVLSETTLFSIDRQADVTFQPNLAAEVSIDDMADFLAMVKKHLWVFDCFEIPVRKDLADKPIRFLTDCLASLSLEIVKTRVSQANNRKVYYYKLNPDRTTQMFDLVRRRSELESKVYIETYWQEVHQKHGIDDTVFTMVIDDGDRFHRVIWVPKQEDLEEKFNRST